MSSEDNVKTVTTVYEAFTRGDIPTVLDALTDDVDWASEAASTDVPWWGPRQGKAEVGAFFEQLGTNMEVTEFTPLVVVGDGDDVLAVIRYGANVTEQRQVRDHAVAPPLEVPRRQDRVVPRLRGHHRDPAGVPGLTPEGSHVVRD